jgi:muramoyltetrapeptide carboxypeptidase LdcA involved in peptidoglycan recycling
VCTPSFPAHVRFRAKYLHGLAELRRLGFEVVEGSLTARATAEGHRSGTPEERAKELNELFADDSIRAIVATIGGNNSSSLVPFLDFDAIRARPKIFCGYSDVTSLHLAIMRRAGVSTFYGPAVMPSFGEWPEVLEETRESFLDAVMRHVAGERELAAPRRFSNHVRDAATDAWRSEERRWQPSAGWRTLRPGLAEGPALVVNLNTLRANTGTIDQPDFDGAILVVEEMASSHALAERAFRHLGAMGVFERIAALVWGRVEHFTDDGSPRSVDELLLEAIRGALGCEPRFPVVADFDCCHTVPMLTIAQGTPLRLDATGPTARLAVLAPMVEPGA